MRIGIDCRMFSSKFTGIGRCTYEFVKHLIEINRDNNFPHELILFFNNPEFHDFKETQNVKKVLVNAKHYSFAEQWTFYRKLKKENLDIVYFPHFNLPILYRKPYVVTIHDLTLSLFPGQKMTKWHHRLAYNLVIKNAVRTAKNVIAVSENTKNDIIKILKISPQKITVIYNGIGEEFTFIQDPKITEKTLKKFNITKEFLLYTGVWRSHKNLPRLIHAFAILKHKYKLNLQLVITGKPDPHYPEVKHCVHLLSLENDIIFPGLVNEEELIHLYNAALFYILPSLHEGFGLPVLESMKCGTPVLASNISSFPEICGESSAIFFDPYDTDGIAEKIYTLYKDPNRQAELIEKGMERAGKFSWTKTAKQIYNLLCHSCDHCHSSDIRGNLAHKFRKISH